MAEPSLIEEISRVLRNGGPLGPRAIATRLRGSARWKGLTKAMVRKALTDNPTVFIKRRDLLWTVWTVRSTADVEIKLIPEKAPMGDRAAKEERRRLEVERAQRRAGRQPAGTSAFDPKRVPGVHPGHPITKAGGNVVETWAKERERRKYIDDDD